RAGGGPADVVGDFHERGGEGFQCPGGKDDFVVRRERGEFVGMRAEGETGELGDFAGGAFGEWAVGVEAGTVAGAANGEIVETIEGHGDARADAVEKTDPAGELLTHGEWRGVLQMGAADLDDASEFLGL